MTRENNVIKNLVDLINKDYHFVDQDGTDLHLYCNPNLNGYELWLARDDTRGITVMYTQYRQVKADVMIMILQMLYHDILNRQNLGYYTISKRS